MTSGMPWALLLFLVPLIAFVVIGRRFIRIVRQLQDPGKLRTLLSHEVLAALRRAGIDPEDFSFEEIKESEELTRLVANDVRRAFGAAILGLETTGLGAAAGAHRSGGPIAPMPQRALPSRDPAQLRPAPLFEHSRSPVPVLAVLTVIGLVAGAVFLLRPG